MVANHPPMELIHHFLDKERSQSAQNTIDLEVGAPSKVEQEDKLRVAIERNLAIDEGGIEAGHRRSSGDGDSEDGVNGGQGDAELSEIAAGSDLQNGEKSRSQSSSGDATKKPWNNSQYPKRTSYPIRANAEDCPFFMKFGSCKFWSSCKFNHPPWRNNQVSRATTKYRDENSEKEVQMECKYYFTSGSCRNGNNCKYSHDLGKGSASQILELNSLGFPTRPGENECPYYMRTGSCKYGANCRFHHPEPTAISRGGPSPGFNNGGPRTSRRFPSSSEGSAFQHVSSPVNQGLVNSNSQWNGYQTAKYTYESGLPIPPAFAMHGDLSPEIFFHLQKQRNNGFEEFPERPDEPECSFFMKTGDCKFKSNCKFHHPKNRISKPRLRPNASSSSLNDKGLPLRPDQPMCTHYYRYGICKYGPACKYDHSSDMDDGAKAAETWQEGEESGDV